MRHLLAGAIICSLVVVGAPCASAQTASQRGFVDGTGWLFPQRTQIDAVRIFGDVLAREELFVKPSRWFQFAVGVEFRASSHDQVDRGHRIDLDDRGALRPMVSLRRLSATLSRGRYTFEFGRQFVRWGKTDIITPTDRFAPRDYLNIVDPEFLGVSAVRALMRLGEETTVEAVLIPRFTPSRTPLVTQRWVVQPPGLAPFTLADGGFRFPTRPQAGVRWAHVGQSIEYSLAFFDGANHSPTIEPGPSALAGQIALVRTYPSIRMYGADAAWPTRWVTVKAEASFVTSSSPNGDEYVLYVVQAERQRGEWGFVAGYAGEFVTRGRSSITFAPDRGLSRAFVARASYTIGPNRSVTFEAAVRQNGRGVYAKADYSHAHGLHLRATLTIRVLAGRSDDFLGQYNRNSHGTFALRYSF